MTRIRIGIDTGGTFTDVVALDEETGAVVTTKTPSTPAQPGDGFLDGVRKSSTRWAADRRRDHRGQPRHDRRHQRAAPGQVRPARLRHQRPATHPGDRPPVGARRLRQLLLLGEARPDRAAATSCAKPSGRLDFKGAELRPFDEEGARTVAAVRDQGIDTPRRLLPALLRQRRARTRMREVVAEEHPDAAVSISCEVLPEYREYERAVTTLVDAFVKPQCRRTSPTSTSRLGDTPATCRST